MTLHFRTVSFPSRRLSRLSDVCGSSFRRLRLLYGSVRICATPGRELYRFVMQIRHADSFPCPHVAFPGFSTISNVHYLRHFRAFAPRSDSRADLTSHFRPGPLFPLFDVFESPFIFISLYGCVCTCATPGRESYGLMQIPFLAHTSPIPVFQRFRFVIICDTFWRSSRVRIRVPT